MDPALIRGAGGAGCNIALWSVRPQLLVRCQELGPNFQSAPWRTLFLDAQSLNSHLGPAVVLAASAIETAVHAVVSAIAAERMQPPDLWPWIQDRGGDYRREPSLREYLDSLLAILAGKGLKSDPKLCKRSPNRTSIATYSFMRASS